MIRVGAPVLVFSLLALTACGGPSESASASLPASTAPAATAATAAAGEYHKADAAAPEVKAAADFAIGEQARRLGSTLTLGAIRSAEQQDIAGLTNFRMCLDYDQDGGGEHATVIVLRNAEQQHSLASWTTAPCE